MELVIYKLQEILNHETHENHEKIILLRRIHFVPFVVKNVPMLILAI
jgi:hypothetical protein